jgi:hypothetical protein
MQFSGSLKAHETMNFRFFSPEVLQVGSSPYVSGALWQANSFAEETVWICNKLKLRIIRKMRLTTQDYLI